MLKIIRYILMDVIHCITKSKGVQNVSNAVRLAKELEEEIDLPAKTRGSNRSAVVCEAIIQYSGRNKGTSIN